MENHEIDKIIQSFSGEYASRDRALFVCGVKTGFRISELLSIKVEDVWQNGRIADRLQVKRRYMKGKGEGRSVVLHQTAKDALLNWLQERDFANLPANSYVFIGRKGQNHPISRIQGHRIIKKAARACSLSGRVASHSMRKSYAVRVYEKLGHDLINTQRALGHKWITSTVAYLNCNQNSIDQAILTA